MVHHESRAHSHHGNAPFVLAELRDDLDGFIAGLAATAVTADVTNLYAPDLPGAALRSANLRHYLHTMRALEPTAVLVGEAPGYRGCRLTGVPFTSERLLLGDAVGSGGYCIAGSPPAAESTATIVWQTLVGLPRLPLLWNACPFHPHRPGNPRTNRSPRLAELMAGEPHFRALLALFPVRRVFAVGRKAALALTRWEIDFTAVRHPSHGGKADFQAAIHDALNPLTP